MDEPESYLPVSFPLSEYLPYVRMFTSFEGTVPCHKSITAGL